MALSQTGTVMLAVLLFAVLVTVMGQVITSGSTGTTQTISVTSPSTGTSASTPKPTVAGNASALSSCTGLAVLALVLAIVRLLH